MSVALVLIDIQNDYFHGGAMELVNMEAAADNAREVLDQFRDGHGPVIHIQHLSVRPGATFFVPETPGAEHNERVTPRAGETVIQKNFPNAFRDTDLESTLRGNAVTGLVIVGAMSHMCIDASTRAAFDLGFQCTVVEDASATRALQFNQRELAADQVHGAFMAALAPLYADVISTATQLAA